MRLTFAQTIATSASAMSSDSSASLASYSYFYDDKMTSISASKVLFVLNLTETLCSILVNRSVCFVSIWQNDSCPHCRASVRELLGLEWQLNSDSELWHFEIDNCADNCYIWYDLSANEKFDLFVSMPVLFLLAMLIAASQNFSSSINDPKVVRFPSPLLLLMLLLLLLLLPVDRLLSLSFMIVTEAVVRWMLQIYRLAEVSWSTLFNIVPLLHYMENCRAWFS